MEYNYKKKYIKYKTKYFKLKKLRNNIIMKGGSKKKFVEANKFQINKTKSGKIYEYNKPTFIFHEVRGDGHCFYHTFLLALKDLFEKRKEENITLFNINLDNMKRIIGETGTESVGIEHVSMLRGILIQLCENYTDVFKQLCLEEAVGTGWGGEYALSLLLSYMRDIDQREIRVVIYNVESNGSVNSVRIFPDENDKHIDLKENNTIFLLRTGRAHYQWMELDNNDYNKRNTIYDYKINENNIVNENDITKIKFDNLASINLTDNEIKQINKDYKHLNYIDVTNKKNLESALIESLNQKYYGVSDEESTQIKYAIEKSLQESFKKKKSGVIDENLEKAINESEKEYNQSLLNQSNLQKAINDSKEQFDYEKAINKSKEEENQSLLNQSNLQKAINDSKEQFDYEKAINKSKEENQSNLQKKMNDSKVYYYNKQFFIDDKNINCKEINSLDNKNKDIFICNNKKKRIKCIKNKYDTISDKHNDYALYSCDKTEEIKDKEFSKITNESIGTTNYDFIIIGGGPVGLYSAYKILHKYKDKYPSVLVIEIRDDYVRNEILMLRNDDPRNENPKYSTICEFKNIDILNNIEKYGCYCKNPFNNIAECNTKKESYSCKENSTINGRRISIRTRYLENILENKFLEIGGIIIRSVDNSNKISLTITDSKLSNIKIIEIKGKFLKINNKEIKIYNGGNFTYNQHLICTDGAHSYTREILQKNTLHFYPTGPNSIVNLNDIKKTNSDIFHKNSISFGIILHIDLGNDFSQLETKTDSNQFKFRMFTPTKNDPIKTTYGAIQIKIEMFDKIIAYIWTQLQAKEKQRDFLKSQLFNYTNFFSDKYSNADLKKDPSYYIDLQESLKVNKKSTKEIYKIFINEIEKFYKYYSIDKIVSDFDDFLNRILKIKVFPIFLFNIANQGFYDKNFKIIWLGDALASPHYFTGSGVNHGIKNAKQFIDVIYKPYDNEYSLNKNEVKSIMNTIDEIDISFKDFLTFSYNASQDFELINNY
jgi:2-polyprenyl-6-methoxyphenol hydroxylase-like FAD-dependent oxidoreductase